MKQNPVALWAGVFAFFGSLVAIGIFDVFNPDQWVEYIGAILVAFITAGSVYAKQMLDDAKKDEQNKTTFQKGE
jgi:cyclopropane fatty-acyl-phospholipid synthase-like methyltransferase